MPATQEAQVPGKDDSADDWRGKVTIATTNAEASPAETDIRKLLIERIQAATRYIYLENYAFTDPQLIEALATKMAQDKALDVMVLIHHPQSPLYSTDTLWSYLQFYSFVELALARFKRIHINGETGAQTLHHERVHGSDSNKVTGCALQKNWSKTEWGWRMEWSQAGSAKSCKLTDIQSIEVPPFMYAPQTTTVIKGKPQWPYPHSKLALIDDKYAFVGSSNWTYRSMEYDGEITAMIEDERVVADIRDKLFTHWQVGLTPANFRDKANQNLEKVKGKTMAADACFVVPLSLEDFVRPDEATYKTKVGMDLGWKWF